MKKLEIALKHSQLIALFILIGYPLLIMIILGWFVIPEVKWYLKEVLSIGLTISFFATLILFISNIRIKKLLAAIFVVLISFATFVKLSFYFHYKVKISASALYVIFETHQSEATDFIRDYFSFEILCLLAVLVIPSFFMFGFLLKSKRFNPFEITLKSSKEFIFGFIAIIAVIFSINWKFKKENLLILSISSYSDYQDTKQVLKNELSKPKSTAISVTNFDNQPQTNIVIIGESTSNWHMQLYGYQRETNPLLTQIESSLMVFDSVIAPNVHTILSLQKVLTLSDFNQPERKPNGSIIQLANQANFETYWLSNQRPIGLHESIPTLIGNAAKHKYFVNSMDYMDTIYDEKLLPVFDSILTDDAQRKLIFIHLIGTHSDYEKRYPEEYAYFSDGENYSKFVPKEKKKRVDAYDNAVRYNDFIVRSIIDKAKKSENVGYVLYFSDHGDEVYDTMNFLGHNEHLATRPMYEVPFLVWFSQNYKKENPQILFSEEITQRPYNLEDFFYSFSDLNKIEFKGFDATKSIFNSGFKKKTRWIKKGINYDSR